ncbi:ATP-binding response regulator [Flavobacterium cerinum]|uniref:histidine kinase n=1 Tax=Flavobacterium cerinum TaxID=2502784 RepID=A0ABY5IWB9_9FLAO|nr:hybrid sensor histidine kinase/response regulator [Flavobacterium cerinum]UUC47127.1 ATP-binding protein [Flavobacterium cerinum]
MKIPLQKRKKVHIALFISIIIIQLLFFWMWYQQNKEYNTLSESVQNANKPNEAIYFSNQATQSFLNAQNAFNDYLLSYKKASLGQYERSIREMTVYLDSLDKLTEVNKDFFNVIKSKETTEKEIYRIRKQLDSLMRRGIIPLMESDSLPPNYNIRKYNYNKTLNSISYDTILTTDKDRKNGFFTRIGKAISGKNNIMKERLQVRIKMIYGNTEKVGSFEDQLKNTFTSIDHYYTQEFKKLNQTYNNLRKKDRELLEINKTILKNSQEILQMYSDSAQELDKLKYITALNNIEKQKTLILTLLAIMIIITIILLFYTQFAYIYEKNLLNAKTEAEKNLEFKNRIIGMLSHEMRAPLNIISNFSKKLKTSRLPETDIPTVNSLIFTSNSLQITMNQILDFFKNRNSKLVVYNSAFNLKNEILSVLESLRSLAEIKKIDLILAIDSKSDTMVWADNVKIHQLFYNIIGNAIKFTKQGHIKVTADLSDKGNQYLLDVIIKDTGAGIPAEDLENIFNEHYQSKFHSEQIKLGAGLGLNLCKEIVALFGGTISVTSVLQKGTEVRFSLLLDKNGTTKTGLEQLREINERNPLSIVAIDDDPIALSIVGKLITTTNARFTGFTSIPELKNHLSVHPVDLILTDLQLDTQSGIQLARDIRSLYTIPIIAITGDDNITRNGNIEELPFESVVSKPVNKEEFYAKILKTVS